MASGLALLPAQALPHGGSEASGATVSAPVPPRGCPASTGVARAVSPGDVVLTTPGYSSDATPAPGTAGHTVFYERNAQLSAADTGGHAGPSPPRIATTIRATVKTPASGDVATGSSTGSTARPAATRSTVRRTRPWTVQVASYETLDEAQAMQAMLCGRGYEARIVGAVRPYDVRVGRYPTSEAAMGVARRLTSRQLTVFITPAE
jgi:cell division septation protein DedD